MKSRVVQLKKLRSAVFSFFRKKLLPVSQNKSSQTFSIWIFFPPSFLPPSFLSFLNLLNCYDTHIMQTVLNARYIPVYRQIYSHQTYFLVEDRQSVQFSRSVVSDSLRPHESQHTRPPCPSPTPGVYSNSCPLSWWCHPAISSSVVPFSSCPQALPVNLTKLIF